MLQVNDRIKYIKENPFIPFPLGTVLTVTDIQGTVLAVETHQNFGFGQRVMRGVMSYDEVEKYFKKIVEDNNKRNMWTDWEVIPTPCDVGMCSEGSCSRCPYTMVCDYDDAIEYKTNGKKIAVRLNTGDDTSIKSYAACHKTDTFDLNTGLSVALARLNVKIAQERLNRIIEQIG